MLKAASEDLLNRGPVWDALSELFLDTELEDADFERLGRALAASPYTLDELEAILHDEVYPVCILNLRPVAGVWAGFDSAWLQGTILRSQRSWFRVPRFLRTGRWMIREPWSKVRDAFRRSRTEAGTSSAEPDAAEDGGAC